MRLSKIHIENFRNFKGIEVEVGDNPVILGENKVGKSNFVHALRLILDPALPDSARDLRIEDLWDGIGDAFSADTRIIIWIELSDFEADENQLAVLAEHLVKPEPMVARLTYVWQVKAGHEGIPRKDSDFEWFMYGGERPENKIGYEIRKSLPIDVLPALRDCEGDLGRWVRSPLRPLLNKASSNIEPEELEELANGIDAATVAVHEQSEVKELAESINHKLLEMVGSAQVLETALRFSPSDPDRLIRALRLYIDGGKRGISDASLGSANVLYLALKALEYDQLVTDGEREHTFLTIEEPEAHLHPHLQRLVFRNYLRPRISEGQTPAKTTVMLTTHSPHIASVTPIKSFVVLRKSSADEGTEAVSTAGLKLTEIEVADLERYIDSTRAELLFAKGVVLVEGESERFVIPVLAKKLGIDLDEAGISVCSIYGTAFGSYLKLVGPNGLGMPYAVLTDRDRAELEREGKKVWISYGHNRYRNNWRVAVTGKGLTSADPAEVAADAKDHGVFFNDSTFEVELFQAGFSAVFKQAAEQLSTNTELKERFVGWADEPDTLDAEQFLKDIETISKGRFSQRLAALISDMDMEEEVFCPDYIKEGLTHVADQCE